MSTVNIKYLKDESGNVISPVVSTDSIYNGTLNLSNYFKPILLASKTDKVAGFTTHTVTNLSNFNYFILNCCTYTKRVLATDILPYNILSETTSDHICIFAEAPNDYRVTINYISDTSVKLGTASKNDSAYLYGVRTL